MPFAGPDGGQGTTVPPRWADEAPAGCRRRTATAPATAPWSLAGAETRRRRNGLVMQSNRPARRSRLPVLLAGSVAIGIALTACSSGGVRTALPRQDDSPAPSASASLPATSSAGSVVEQRYVGFQRVVAESGASSNADDPRLADYATGAVLENLRGKLAVRRQAGTRLYGTPIPHVQSVSVSGDRATVRDCLDNSGTGLIDRAGKKLSVGRPRQATTATLVLKGGVWKVSEITTVAGGGAC